MKKIYISLFFAFFAVKAISQPNLTSSNTTPTAGQTFNYSIDNSFSKTVDLSVTGADVTWNLSGLTNSGGSGTTSYINVAGTKYAGSYPSANLVQDDGDTQFYLSTTADSITNIGDTSFQTTTGVIEKFANPQILMKFPFTYNSNYADSFAISYINMGYGFPMQIDYNGSITAKSDGWGKLQMPYGILYDVLRIRFVNRNTRTMTAMGTTGVMDNTTVTYAWYQQGVHFPVLTIDSMYVPSQSAASRGNGQYLDASYVVVGVNENNNIASVNFMLYPNPSNTKSTTIMYSLENSSMVKVNISNILGQNIKEFDYENQSAGVYNKTINLTELQEGIYFITLNIDNNTITKKLIVE